MSSKILIVDDDRNMLLACERILRGKFDIETAIGAQVALNKISNNSVYAVVVADRQMPGMDGVEFLKKVREISPDTVRLMLTGNANLESVIQLVNETGIFRFLTKPCPGTLLASTLQEALRLYELGVSEKQLLTGTLDGSIKVLTEILGLVESHVMGPTPAERDIILKAADDLGLENSWEIHLAVMLASIGDVAIPPDTLVRARSGQPLTVAEGQMLNRRPETAARLLAHIPRLDGVAKIIRYQNKGFDGSGLPEDDLAGDAIPAGARLLKIIHDYNGLRRAGMTLAEAFLKMGERNGIYDPVLLASLRDALEGNNTQIRARNPSRSLPVADLATEMVMRSNVETKDGLLILRAGNKLTEMTLEKIRNFHNLFGVKEPVQVEWTGFAA